MISVILSAGMGTRLRPLTDEIPKPLLEINKLTLLERMIGNCMNAGIREFILVVGYKKEKVLEIAPKLEDELDISIKIIENEEYNETNTSVSTYLASLYIENEKPDDFILINGDNVVDPKIIERIVKTDNTSLIVDDFKDLNEESFKLILDDMKTNADNSIANGIISEIGKEIDIPSSTGEFIGVSKVIKEDLPHFNEILSQLIDEDRQNYYDFAYKPLSRDTTIDYVLTNGLKWTEIDDHNDWKIANNLIDEFEN
ncbi:phosphocholine cytidylyltransferase family protein [uncultured Methanobrevibacter sp.]|uniref:phosphocholine cytidylyltransferase family protein n=1 Tax=uncultured Methanobrevibacter sp. TaxID=253161 RepID=UPI0026015BC1|nr:phosphocholine cytidylyltransferase family protein [uncultured Methanobrevibacter sp.]